MHCKQYVCVGTNHALLFDWARGIANTSQLFSKSKHSKCQLDLQRTGAEAFILDLRSNPGGLVRSSLDVARIFLDGPTAVFNVTGRNGGELPVAAQVSDYLKNISYLKFRLVLCFAQLDQLLLVSPDVLLSMAKPQNHIRSRTNRISYCCANLLDANCTLSSRRRSFWKKVDQTHSCRLLCL